MRETAASLDERLLLDRCRQGDEQARKMLLSRYSQPVFGVVLSLAGCDRDAAYHLSVSSLVETLQAIQHAGTARTFWGVFLPILISKAQGQKPTPAFEASGVPTLSLVLYPD